jgi:hypothetical protein
VGEAAITSRRRPARPLPTALATGPAERAWVVRRRAAVRIGVLVARAFDHASGSHPDRCRALVGWRPARLAWRWAQGTLTTLLAGRVWAIGPPNAVLAVTPLDARARWQRLARTTVLFATAGVLVAAAGQLASVRARPGVAVLVAVATVTAAAAGAAVLLGWASVRMLTGELHAAGLHTARRRLLAQHHGPVWLVVLLASRKPGAGVRLGGALCAAADHAQVTLLATADGAARPRLYARGGFQPYATVACPWGPATLLIRHPQPPPAAAAATAASHPGRILHSDATIYHGELRDARARRLSDSA